MTIQNSLNCRIVNLRFFNNSAQSLLYISSNDNILIKDCVFSNNTLVDLDYGLKFSLFTL